MESIYKQIGIYRITNLVNGKSYIGKTGMNFGDRWDCHRAQLRGGYHDNPYLQHAWDKYGEENFEFAVVEVVSDVSNLNDLEIKYIREYRDAGLSYNLHDGGDGGYNLGKHLSEETKRKIGEKNRQNMLGRKANDETKHRMSEAQRARWRDASEEDRKAWGKKIGECASGYKWTDEQRAKFSRLQQTHPNGAKFTPEDIKIIRGLAECGISHQDIASVFNTTAAYVGSIVSRRRWANIN